MAWVPASRPGRRSAGGCLAQWAWVSAALVLAIALGGCAGWGRDVPAGAGGVTIERSAGPSRSGCAIQSTRFEPRRRRTAVPVILAPGFLRDQGHLAGLARALAEQGIPAVTLDLCNSRPWDAQPVRSALDMIALARRSGAHAVVYGGFSAGALAALIAGRLDPRTRGVLALDLVDQGGLGVGIARALDRPLLGLAGEPAACNAYGNGVPVFAVAPRARVTPIRGAGHCDFEAPTDRLCQALCSGSEFGSAARRQVIIRTAVAAVAEILGLAGHAGHPFRGQPKSWD